MGDWLQINSDLIRQVAGLNTQISIVRNCTCTWGSITAIRIYTLSIYFTGVYF